MSRIVRRVDENYSFYLIDSFIFKKSREITFVRYIDGWSIIFYYRLTFLCVCSRTVKTTVLYWFLFSSYSSKILRHTNLLDEQHKQNIKIIEDHTPHPSTTINSIFSFDFFDKLKEYFIFRLSTTVIHQFYYRMRFRTLSKIFFMICLTYYQFNTKPKHTSVLMTKKKPEPWQYWKTQRRLW